jgi:hypothetical protein
MLRESRPKSAFMNTGTPGITVTAAGHHIIDKEYRGVRIFTRLGRASQAEAAPASQYLNG